VQITVNGRSHTVDVDPQKPLLWVLREDLGLSGAKYGCGMGLCGTCKVLLDGAVTSSCSIPATSADGGQVVTIEGLSRVRLSRHMPFFPIIPILLTKTLLRT
jgi:isoquinoline 1-oxidoreductase alpha subunit